MSEQPDLSTLPKRMRYAATVLAEADARYARYTRKQMVDDCFGWDSQSLQSVADEWEAQDREVAEHKTLIENLAREMFTEQGRLYPKHENFKLPFDEAGAGSQSNCRRLAAALIDAGWRKVDPE